MTHAGAMYLSARQGAADHRLAAGIAAATGHPVTANRHATAAELHSHNADEIRSQFAAARKLGLGGREGTVPPGYFGDSPSCVSQQREKRSEGGHRPTQSPASSL